MTRGIVQVTSPRLPYTHVFHVLVQRNPVARVRVAVCEYVHTVRDARRESFDLIV